MIDVFELALRFLRLQRLTPARVHVREPDCGNLLDDVAEGATWIAVADDDGRARWCGHELPIGVHDVAAVPQWGRNALLDALADHYGADVYAGPGAYEARALTLPGRGSTAWLLDDYGDDDLALRHAPDEAAIAGLCALDPFRDVVHVGDFVAPRDRPQDTRIAWRGEVALLEPLTLSQVATKRVWTLLPANTDEPWPDRRFAPRFLRLRVAGDERDRVLHLPIDFSRSIATDGPQKNS